MKQIDKIHLIAINMRNGILNHSLKSSRYVLISISMWYKTNRFSTASTIQIVSLPSRICSVWPFICYPRWTPSCLALIQIPVTCTCSADLKPNDVSVNAGQLWYLFEYYIYSAYSRLAPRQWETSLQKIVVSHWLSANLKSALILYYAANDLYTVLLDFDLLCFCYQ